MTAIESPVTVTTTPSATTARCECGKWMLTLGHTYLVERDPLARVLDEWAEHWHDTHTEGDNE